VRAEREDLPHLLDVGTNVVVGEHHPLGLAVEPLEKITVARSSSSTFFSRRERVRAFARKKRCHNTL